MCTEVNSRIFIGGTGRSGTHAIASVLGSHPDVALLPSETHFIVDPGGLRELHDVLTTRYDFYRGSDAFSRFDELMRLHLVGRTNTIKRFVRLDRLFGEAKYFRALDTFESALTLVEFDEKLFPEASPEGVPFSFGPSESKAYRRVVPRYYSDPDELSMICRDFVESLFGQYAAEHGKTAWCELTPFNLFNMDFLWDLYPQATIIHMKRDPRGVAVSMQHQPWAPSDLNSVVDLLIPAYERWLDYKQQLSLSERSYLEIKIEDLAANQPEIEELVYSQCGLVSFRADVSIDPQRAIWWHKAVSTQEARALTKRLYPYIEAMGYDPN